MSDKVKILYRSFYLDQNDIYISKYLKNFFLAYIVMLVL